jgi:UDP-N-acetylglucosamine 2-epimerase
MQRVLARRVELTVVRDATEALYHGRLWQSALAKLRPRALVTFNAYNNQLAAGVLQARYRDVPTLCLQHGIWRPLMQAAALLPYHEVPVVGDYARKMLQPTAADHTRFGLTGHSLYDDLAESADASELRAELIGAREHVVTVTTQPIEVRLCESEQRWWLTALAEACERLNAMMVIKPHPQDDEMLSRYRRMSERMPGVRLMPHGEAPLKEIIAASDLLVTRFSTTAIEAALIGVPVMTVNLSGGPDQYPYTEEGAAMGVSDYDEIAPTLRRLLTDTGARNRILDSQNVFLDRHVGPRDGGATRRIAETIAELAHRSRPKHDPDGISCEEH